MATNMCVNYDNEPLFATPDFILNECKQHDTKTKVWILDNKILNMQGKSSKRKGNAHK